MWPPQSVNTWPTPAPLSVRATSSPPVIQSEGRAPSEPPRLSSRRPPRFTASPRLPLRLALRPRDGLRLARPHPTDPPRPAGPQPRDGLRLARPHPQTRLAARVAEPPRPPLGSHGHIHRLASRRASPSLRGRRSARTTTSTDSPRGARRRASAAAARLARPHPQAPPRRRGPRPPTAPGAPRPPPQLLPPYGPSGPA